MAFRILRSCAPKNVCMWTKPYIGSAEKVQTVKFRAWRAEFNKQRRVERSGIAETGIAHKILHVHVFACLMDGFPIAKITYMFDDQCAKCYARIDSTGAGLTIAHLFDVNLYQNIPWYLPSKNYQPLSGDKLPENGSPKQGSTP